MLEGTLGIVVYVLIKVAVILLGFVMLMVTVFIWLECKYSVVL